MSSFGAGVIVLLLLLGMIANNVGIAGAAVCLTVMDV